MQIPKEVKDVLQRLAHAGFEAYTVGGCVRDLLRGKNPKDWDVTTNANPEEVRSLFPESFYENKFGTVTVKTGSQKENLAEIEVTTYRIDEKYSDKRHPDRVRFTASLEEDLQRRDFTINAMALGLGGPTSPLSHEATLRPSVATKGGGGEGHGNLQPPTSNLVDLFGGQKDVEDKIIRAVGKPEDRFGEDALRMLRAVRLATELGFTIEENTFRAIKENAKSIDLIAKERVRDELIKIIDTKQAYDGIILLKDTGLLRVILPDLAAGVGVGQNKHHIYTVFEHNALALKWGAEHDYPFHVKLAALLHDVGKVATKRGEGSDSTFYGHEIVGAKISKGLLTNLHFPVKLEHAVSMLVKYHLFYYNVGEVTAKSVRRLVAKVGPENMADLIKVRICDRMGSGVPKPEPYRLRHFQYMVARVQKDPTSPKMLKINGDVIMKILGIGQGIEVGQILAILLDEVLDDPKLNTKKYLEKRAKELNQLPDNDLRQLTQKAREQQAEFDKAVDEKIKERYWVT